ncbi:hypothetical protein [Nocardiopsis flavescens]
MDEHHGEDGLELPAADPQGRPYVGTARVTETTRQRLVSRTCGWCGETVPYTGKGRPPKYCSKAHRNRAWEVRSAAARLEADREAGAAAADGEPVREVIRETVTRTATRSARVEVPRPYPVERPARPGKAREVEEYLDQVAAAVRRGDIGHYDHRRLLRSVRAVLAAIDATYPGGLERLRG